MSILKRKGSIVNWDYQLKEIRKEADSAGMDSLDWLASCSEYHIVKYRKPSRTLFNRINLLWVFPLFLVMSPFQWMFYGDTGFRLDSSIGRAVNWLVNLKA